MPLAGGEVNVTPSARDSTSLAPPPLPRKFGFWSGHFLVVASMVGAGILTTSGFTLRDTGNPAALMSLWVVGGLLALCGTVTIAEMATTLPRAGSDYLFVREAFGPSAGVVAGWATFVLGFAAPTALVARLAVSYVSAPLEDFLTPWISKAILSGIQPLLASLLIAGIAIAHCMGHRESAWLQVTATLVKISILIGLIVAGLVIGRGDWNHLNASSWPTSNQWPALAIGLIYVGYSYSGWNAAAYIAGEIRDPQRLLPQALISGCLAVVVLYLLVNLTYVYALDPEEMMRRSPGEVERVAELAAEQLFGPRAAAAIAVLLGIGLMASVSAYLLAGPRLTYAMALDGAFPLFASRLHPTRATPAHAIIAQGVLAIGFVWSGPFLTILEYTAVGLAAVSGLVVASIFPLRRRRDLNFPYRMPFFPIPPLLYLGITGWTIAANVIRSESRAPAILSLATLLLGIPIARWILAAPADAAARTKQD
ncbi:MAG: APC family permease [Pirellulales bacterium]